MKKLPQIIIALVLAAGVAFYGGMKYGQSKSPQGLIQGDFQALRNLSAEEREQGMQQMGAAGMGFIAGRAGIRSGSAFIAGEVISKDEESLTIKLPDGGSKIIFYSDKTEVGKFVDGTSDDFEIGQPVVVNGKTNEDGSVTAQSIQLRTGITQ